MTGGGEGDERTLLHAAIRGGHAELAARLVQEELVDARRWGAPRAIAGSLRVLARIVGDVEVLGALGLILTGTTGIALRKGRVGQAALLAAMPQRASAASSSRSATSTAQLSARRALSCPASACV